MMRGGRLMAILLCGVLLGGCVAAPPIAEPIVHHRAASSVRAYEAAWDAVCAARRTLEGALGELTDESLAGLTPAQAYGRARRAMIRVDARVENVRRKYSDADASALEILDAWFAEQWKYSDERLRNDTRERLKRGHGARDTIRTSMRRVLDALGETRTELSDRTLFLKHCRDEGRLRPLPVSEEGAHKYARARADLEESSALLRAAIDDWRTLLGQPREKTP